MDRSLYARYLNPNICMNIIRKLTYSRLHLDAKHFQQLWMAKIVGNGVSTFIPSILVDQITSNLLPLIVRVSWWRGNTNNNERGSLIVHFILPLFHPLLPLTVAINHQSNGREERSKNWICPFLCTVQLCLN